jgi:hypothetical protein
MMATVISQKASNAAGTANLLNSLQNVSNTAITRDAHYEQKRAAAWKEIMDFAEAEANRMQATHPGIRASDMFKSANFVNFAEQRAAASGVSLFGDTEEKRGFFDRVFGSTTRDTSGNRAGFQELGRAYGGQPGLQYGMEEQMFTGTLDEGAPMRQNTDELNAYLTQVLGYQRPEPVRPDEGGGGRAPAPMPPQESARTPSPAPAERFQFNVGNHTGMIGDIRELIGSGHVDTPKAKYDQLSGASNYGVQGLNLQGITQPANAEQEAARVANEKMRQTLQGVPALPGGPGAPNGLPSDVNYGGINAPVVRPAPPNMIMSPGAIAARDAQAPQGEIPVSEPPVNEATAGHMNQLLNQLRDDEYNRLMAQYAAQPKGKSLGQFLLENEQQIQETLKARQTPSYVETPDPREALPQVPSGNEGVGAQAAPVDPTAELKAFWDYALAQKKAGNPAFAGMSAQNPAAGQPVESLQRLAAQMANNFNAWRSGQGQTPAAAQVPSAPSAPVQQAAPMPPVAEAPPAPPMPVAPEGITRPQEGPQAPWNPRSFNERQPPMPGSPLQRPEEIDITPASVNTPPAQNVSTSSPIQSQEVRSTDNNFNEATSRLGWKEQDVLLVQKFLKNDATLDGADKHQASVLLQKAQTELVKNVREETSRLPRWTPNENVDPELVRQVDNYMKVSDPNGPYTKAMRDDPRFSHLLETTASQASKTRDATIKKLYADGELTMAQARAIAQAGDAVETLSAIEMMSKNSEAFKTLISMREMHTKVLSEPYMNRIESAKTDTDKQKIMNEYHEAIANHPSIKSTDMEIFKLAGQYLGSPVSTTVRQMLQKSFFGLITSPVEGSPVVGFDSNAPATSGATVPAQNIDPETYKEAIFDYLNKSGMGGL